MVGKIMSCPAHPSERPPGAGSWTRPLGLVSDKVSEPEPDGIHGRCAILTAAPENRGSRHPVLLLSSTQCVT